MAKKPSVNVIVHDCYTAKEKHLVTKKKALRLYFGGEKRNIHDDMEHIEKLLNGKVESLLKDLYHIALVVYLWDLNTPRKQTAPRYFSALMSVSSKDKWNTVKSHLESTLGFLSGDTFDFHFVQGEPPDKIGFPKKNNKCVALFSGGLDSLAGFKWMLDNGIDPVLVSHQAAPLTAAVQRRLVDSLQKATAKSIEWYQIRAVAEGGKGLRAKESTQFSRSFLYLTIGAVFALMKGMPIEYIFENGVIALNIPLTPSRIYSSTRTAHPQFLAKYQILLNSLFGHRLTIKNPFLELTKGEVVKLLDSKGFRQLVGETVTCPYCLLMRWRRVPTSKIKNDGYCFPCIVRRSAVHYANLEKYDSPYQNDITLAYSTIPEEGKKTLLEMMDFAREIDKFTNAAEALLEYPQFYVGDTADPVKLFNMVKRHNRQFQDFISQRGHNTLRQNFNIP